MALPLLLYVNDKRIQLSLNAVYTGSKHIYVEEEATLGSWQGLCLLHYRS